MQTNTLVTSTVFTCANNEEKRVAHCRPAIVRQLQSRFQTMATNQSRPNGCRLDMYDLFVSMYIKYMRQMLFRQRCIMLDKIADVL